MDNLPKYTLRCHVKLAGHTFILFISLGKFADLSELIKITSVINFAPPPHRLDLPQETVIIRVGSSFYCHAFIVWRAL